MHTLKIAILAGGSSREAEVSHSSAAQVAQALEQVFSEVVTFELDTKLAGSLIKFNPDVVFPVLHGPPGEDGTVQGFLEVMGLAYVGSDVHASAAAMDKGIAKSLFHGIGLPVCGGLNYAANVNAQKAAAEIQSKLGDRVVIKPLNQGSAVGVVPLMNGGDIEAALEESLSLGLDVLVEPYIFGREMTVGVLDLEGENAVSTPVIDIVTPADTWYDYKHRYGVGLSEHVIPAVLPEKTTVELQNIALNAHSVLKCRDLSRADFIVNDNNEIVLLEVNTLPGMTPTSLYPDGLAALGINFTSLMEKLVLSALRRGASII